jgi:hypothetical protein
VTVSARRSSTGTFTLSRLISFQIRIGTMPERNKLGLIARDIDDRDVPRANLVLGQLRTRNLQVATAMFAEQLARSLEGMRSEPASWGDQMPLELDLYDGARSVRATAPRS